MASRFMSSLAIGVSAVALTFSTMANAGLVDNSEHIETAVGNINGALMQDNGLKTAEKNVTKELSTTLVQAISAGLANPKDKNTIVAFTTKHPTKFETYGAAAVIPAKDMPKDTPIPVCLSVNGKPTSAWNLMPNGSKQPSSVILNAPDQVEAGRPACFATLVAAKKGMDAQLLAQRQNVVPPAAASPAPAHRNFKRSGL